MEESSILSKFDSLVKSGLVLYDDNQETIEYIDGQLKQYEPLDGNDLEATYRILSIMRTDYVIFYNYGQNGGCSRLHKHLQLIPMPKAGFAAFLDTQDGKEPDVPFQWFYERFESGSPAPAEIFETYTKLVEQATKVGQLRSEHADRAPSGATCPHNPILTNRWIMVLPRRKAAINKEAGVNALGLLGYITAATKSEIDNWIRVGPTRALREFGVPKNI